MLEYGIFYDVQNYDGICKNTLEKREPDPRGGTGGTRGGTGGTHFNDVFCTSANDAGICLNMLYSTMCRAMMEYARISTDAPGGPRRPQEATGGLRRPQAAPGGPRRPQKAPGSLRRPQEAPQKAPGGPKEAPGGPRRPQEAPGAARSSQKRPGAVTLFFHT